MLPITPSRTGRSRIVDRHVRAWARPSRAQLRLKLWRYVGTMSGQIGIRELRDNLTATVRRVRAGETIEITHHQGRVAVPAPAPVDRIDRLHEASDITPGVPLDEPLQRYPVTGANTSSDALQDDR